MNYGVIGNCQVAALVDEQARMVWACLPRPDGDPVFSALLQKEGGESATGVFAIDMVDLTRSEQTYLRNSAIIETRLYDAHGGVVRIVDFAPRFRSRGRVFRPMMFVRSVEPIAGRPTLRVRLRPTAGFGERCDPGISGSHHIRFAADGLHYRVTTDASLASLLEDRPVVLEHALHFVIGPDETLQESPAALTREFLGATLTYWQEWVRTLAVPADWQDAVIRSAITLKLCTYEDTGAVLAALTTSIPEAAAQHAQLGLPILLAARQLLRRADPQSPRCDAHDGGVSPLHRSHRCILDGRYLATAVRHHRRSARRGKGGDEPLRISRHGSGAIRQSRRRPGAARCVRFGDPRGDAALLRRAAGAVRRSDIARAVVPAGQTRGGHVRRARRGAVGIPRQAAAPHLLRRHFLGGVRSPGAHRAPRG